MRGVFEPHREIAMCELITDMAEMLSKRCEKNSEAVKVCAALIAGACSPPTTGHVDMMKLLSALNIITETIGAIVVDGTPAVTSPEEARKLIEQAKARVVRS